MSAAAIVMAPARTTNTITRGRRISPMAFSLRNHSGSGQVQEWRSRKSNRQGGDFARQRRQYLDVQFEHGIAQGHSCHIAFSHSERKGIFRMQGHIWLW